jgi:hypothetical protein
VIVEQANRAGRACPSAVMATGVPGPAYAKPVGASGSITACALDERRVRASKAKYWSGRMRISAGE